MVLNEGFIAGRAEKTQESEKVKEEVEKEKIESFIADYNEEAGIPSTESKGDFYRKHEGLTRVGTSNALQRCQDLRIEPIFTNADDGEFFFYETQSGKEAVAVPRLYLTFEEMSYGPGAMGKIFDCPGYDPQNRKGYRGVKVVRPARFRFDSGKQQWFLTEKGELDLGLGITPAAKEAREEKKEFKKIKVEEVKEQEQAQAPVEQPAPGGEQAIKQPAVASEQPIEEPKVEIKEQPPMEETEPEPAVKKPEEARERPAAPPHEERPPEKPPTSFEKRKKAVFADISDVIEQEARDAAATAMTEEREKLKGFKGALKRFWRHSFLDGYYRSRELHKARREIRETKNIYVAEIADQQASDQAKSVIMERFANEHTEEMLGAGEEKEFHNDLKEDALAAVNEYARTGDDNNWQARCAEILEKVAQKHNLKGKEMLESVNYVSNLYKIAQETRQAYLLGESQGRAQEALLEDIEIIWGRAKSSVRTEAQFNRLDRVIDRVEKSRVAGRISGIFGNEFAVAAGLSIAYCLARKPLETVLRTRTAKWATFGAGVAVTAGLAGARESHRLELERRQHFRDMAKGKTFEKAKAPRREEMEKFRYDTLGADYLMDSMQGLYKKYDPEGERELRVLSDAEKEAALKLLSEIESRTKLMDEHKIDLIHYSDIGKVEEERFKLNLLRSQLKVDLRKSDPRDFDQKLETAANTNADFLLKESEESILEKDRLFKRMKREKVAKTVCKVMATGLVFGALAQEAGAFVSEKQEGLVEGWIKGGTKGERLTALAKLKEVITGGDIVKGEKGLAKTFNVGDKLFKAALPEGADLVDPENDGIFKLIYNGRDVYDGIRFNPDGTIAKESIAALAQKGIHIDNSVAETVKGFIGEDGVDGKTAREEFIDKNPGLFQKVKRILWYDNDTPKPLFDKNELKLWWGGVKGMGVNENGDFVFNIKQMAPDGSFHALHTIDAQQAMKAGKLKLLLSLSRDTQNNVIEVPIQPNGDAVIAKGSEAAKMMLEKGADGKAVFLGKYAEVAEVVSQKSKDGRGLMRILATHIGEETGKPPKVPVPEKVHIPIFELPRTRPGDLPPLIPIFGRRPLEPAERGPIVVPPYYYGGPVSPELRRVFEQRRSETLARDPEAELDHFQEAEKYVEGLSEEHRAQVEGLAEQAGDMSPEVRLSVCIPVAGHQEGKNIYESLKNYTYQTADRSKFELVLFVNHPDKDKAGREIKPDDTFEEIERFKNDFPDMKVAVIRSVLPLKQAKIGGIRKLLNDATLLRHHQRGADVPDLIMVSNDADNKGIAPEYVENFIGKFNENPKVDGMLGQLDWDPESYTKYPLVHIGTRLFQYLSVIGRHRSGSMVSSGANFAFRSSIYSAIGGYITELPGGEDVAVGQAIIEARKSRDRIKFAGARTSRLFTSSRRAIKTLEAGKAPIEQWDAGFSALDDAVRRFELGKGRVLDYEDAEVLDKLKGDLTLVINRTLDAYEKGEKLGKDHAFYRKALGWLGIKYKLNQAGDVVITDMSLLVDGLKEYQKLGVLIRDAKSGKKEAIEELKGTRAAMRVSATEEARRTAKVVEEEHKELEKQVDSKMQEFYSRDKLGLDTAYEAVDIDIERKSQDKENIGEYVIARDLELSKEETGVVARAFKRGAENRPLVAKIVAMDYMKRQAELNKLPEGILTPEQFLQDKHFSHPSVLMPEEAITDKDRFIRFYEAADIDLEKYDKSKLSPRQALSLVIRGCDGIRALHKAGVAFVDFAPLNIVATKDNVRVIDLDGAKIDTSGEGRFDNSFVKGNRFTLAPEAFFAKTPFVDKTIDIYAASAVLYLLVAGKWPYDIERRTKNLPFDDKMREYQKLHEAGKISFPASMPPQLKRIIRKGMGLSPASRYQSMGEFLKELLDVYEVL